MSNEHRMGNQPPLNVPQEHLAAEVERLREENAGLKGFADQTQVGLQRNAIAWQAKVAEIEAQNAEAVETVSGIVQQRNEWIERKRQLEAENAELRKDLEWAQRSAHAQTTDTRLNVLRNKNEALKKQLAWFEEAWSWVKAAMLRVQELEEVKAFRRDEVLLKLVAPIIRKIEERDRPKPEEGT